VIDAQIDPRESYMDVVSPLSPRKAYGS
jgi:hypothetical protein